ncbi:hypothetical protein TNCV_3762501 [Trichonephila clavipes]|nr:hypothetical protein TNCV_3762501 [Trichonephila clavipes]
MAEPSKHTSRLFLLDRKSGQKFLIDSGSEICVIPPSPTMNKSPQSNFSLFAANNTKIPAYGMVRKELNLGLRRPFIWTFIIADVSSPIIGADFLKHFNLLIDLKKKGIIRPSKSPWSSLHVVPKSDSTVRPVGDYRQLNSVTEFDSYPMPYLNDFAHALHGKRIFSKIDIFKAFHQIPIAECDIPKTAVTTPWGLYEYTHLCFGLVNAPQTFMRFMHEVLRGLPFCFVYLDDILCYSENAEEHRSHLRTIFQRLSSYGLKLNISKCVFGVTELIFLGHLITPDGIKPLPDKVQAVLDYKQPETVGSLRKFLGLLNFYRRKKDSKPLNWSSEAITAFQRCKQALADAALLAHPSPSSFESSLFKALSKLLGVQKCRTTGYHPQANGMIEELHRPLKSAIKCHATERWTEVLPIILLGLRASLKEDILCTPAELVFGTTIRLPGEMFDSSNPDDDVVNFVSKLKSHMHNHFTLNHQNTMANVQFLSIQDCWKQHMFFFAETCYVVHFNNPMMALSKCKPAFFLNTEDLQLPQTKNETPATVEPNATASTPATVESDPTASTPTQPSTRSGRKVHLPTRINHYNSIFSAETLAICQALDDLVESSVNLLVLSDSLSVLSALQNFSIKSNKVIHRLANKIYMLSNYVNQLILLWTPGHSKIVWNEQADNLARSVTESNVYIDWIASEDIHKNIYRNRIQKINETFYSSKYFEKLGNIPTIDIISKWTENRIEEILSTRFFSKMIITPGLLHRFNLQDNAMCITWTTLY